MNEFNYEQETTGTSYDYKVGGKVEYLIDKGYIQIFVTKMDDGWEIVGRKPKGEE
jgi:hypothetical protein